MKYIFTLTLLLTLTIHSFGQRSLWTGYRVYSSLLNSKNLDPATSVVILDQLEIENYSLGLVEAIKSRNRQMIYFYTKTEAIDSSTFQLILDYFKNQTKEPLDATGFNLQVPVIMINNAVLDKMFKPSVTQGWISFNKKYHNSSGLFQFSRVYFSKDVTKAVFYYSHRQSEFKEGGDLVIMERVNNKWQVKYQFNLRQDKQKN